MSISENSGNKNQTFSILINQWSNLSKSYKTVAQVSGSLFGTHVLESQVIYPDQSGEFSSLCLGKPGETHTPAIIESLLPQGFSKQIARCADSEWDKVSDIVKLIKLGSRDMGAINVVVDDRNVDSKLIKNRDTLNEFLNQLHVALNTHELNGLLSESNRDSLLNTRGEQPKIIYQDEAGESWIVKTDTHQLSTLEDVTAKTEYALLTAMEEAGMDVPENKLFKTYEGRHVLMVKRYDIDTPSFKNDSPNATYENRYRFVSAEALVNQLGSTPKTATYSTIVDAVNRFCTNTKTTTEIKQKLMERAIFDAMVNNTETSMSTLNFYVGTESESCIKIAPMTGLSSDQMGNAFLLPISEKYSSQSRIKLDNDFAQEVAKVFESDIAMVKRTIARIANSVFAMEVHMHNAGMTSKEKYYANDAFISKDTLRAGLALAKDADAQTFKSQSQNAFNMGSSSKTSSPSNN